MDRGKDNLKSVCLTQEEVSFFMGIADVDIKVAELGYNQLTVVNIHMRHFINSRFSNLPECHAIVYCVLGSCNLCSNNPDKKPHHRYQSSFNNIVL